MSKIIQNYSQIITLHLVLDNYVRNNPESKLSAGIKKFYQKGFSEILLDYNDRLDTLKIIHCLVDPITKAILKNDKEEKQFSIEGALKLKEDNKKLLKEEVEITPFIMEGLDNLVLLDQEIELFTGIVI